MRAGVVLVGAVTLLVVTLTPSLVLIIAEKEYEYWAPRLASRVIGVLSRALPERARDAYQSEWLPRLVKAQRCGGSVTFVLTEALPAFPGAAWSAWSDRVRLRPDQLLRTEVLVGVAVLLAEAAWCRPHWFAVVALGGFVFAVLLLALGLLLLHLGFDRWVPTTGSSVARLTGFGLPRPALELMLPFAAWVALVHLLLLANFVESSADRAVMFGQGMTVALTACVVVVQWWDRRAGALRI